MKFVRVRRSRRVLTSQRQPAVHAIVHSAPKRAQLDSPGQEPPQAGARLGFDTIISAKACRAVTPASECTAHGVMPATPAFDAILIADYGKAVCTPRLLRAVIDAEIAASIPALIDPARGADYARYRGAHQAQPAGGRSRRGLPHSHSGHKGGHSTLLQ